MDTDFSPACGGATRAFVSAGTGVFSAARYRASSSGVRIFGRAMSSFV